MSAQINLVQSGNANKREILSLTQMVALVFVLYAGLITMGTWAWWQTTSQQKQAAGIADEAKKIKEQIAEANQKAARANPQLIAEIEQVQALVRKRDDMARLLEAKATSSGDGFSEHLRALAYQIPEGLWLTGISIVAEGRDVEIRGSLIDTAALPEYIQRLGTERTFRGRNFSTLSLTRVAPPARPLNTSTSVSPVTLAVQQGIVTPDLQAKLTEKHGAFVGVIPTKTASGQLADVMDFVLTPQHKNGQEAKEAKP